MNSLISTEWDFAGQCENPYCRTIRGAPQGKDGIISVDRNRADKSAFYVDFTARCRKCGPCLRLRGYEWTKRCTTELALAKFIGTRGWFVTFTFKPGFHLWALGAIGETRREFPQVARIANRAVTLWLKRLRRGGCAFRYCVVMEPHKSGVPHLHGIFTELDAGHPLTERKMRNGWSENGFLNAKLIDLEEDLGRSSKYVSKYLTKAMLARVRASERYGRPLALAPTGGVLLDPPPSPVNWGFNKAEGLNKSNLSGVGHAPR